MATPTDPDAKTYEQVWRAERRHVLAALARRHGDPADCEDAVQQALLAAAEQWPREGMPQSPRAWLVRVASRRLIDQVRADEARRRREEVVEQQERALHGGASRPDPPSEHEPTAVADDTLELMLRCCHPAISPSSRVALTLRAVGGLTTREIAAGFLVPEATMAQRISRARATLAGDGARFGSPDTEELAERLAAVRHVVSVIFTEGHQRSSGDTVVDEAFADEAIRLARVLRAADPDDPESSGLLALLLLTHARAAARADHAGDLVPLEQQDRTRWDCALIAEGVRLLEECLPAGEVGPFQLQAAVAAVHAEAACPQETDWPQILVLYRMLDRVAPAPATTLALAGATAEVEGAAAGLEVLGRIQDERWHRPYAVRGHLLRRLGDEQGAREAFATAARLTCSVPEQRYLHRLVREPG
ncbi:RNA polymerase sigma-70 factor, ECF subfamily [Serinicoccus hydrothermalis]|uniref:RNA polymerase sigma-70 factor, ECF subfamily n=1 Tax=Serinicoccus hydrothermalis TaxID=1758689 RepID=A0A1B1NEA3_9MICO|nr:sigma-70 family RNA polymerase sigma factor [Serinicoccus hydrothermalis]ANS79754.1 RNA polymerase sigma-70 factor, ECF subfamily [Serinicoccus hydrothermalis]